MASFCYNLITINGKFHWKGSLVRSHLWSVNRKELQKVFPGGEMKNNFVKIKFDCGITCLIYTKGSFKVVCTKKNCIDLISNLEEIICCIRTRHANFLFKNKLLASTYKITQVLMSVHCIEEKTLKLTFEKVINHFPKDYVIDKLRIPFKNSLFFLLIDHTQHESGSSHLNFKIEIEGKKVALCKIFNNFKILVFLKYTTYINQVFHLVSEFCRNLHQICSAT